MNYQLHNQIHEWIMLANLLTAPAIIIGGLLTIKTERLFKLSVLMGIYLVIFFASAFIGFASLPALCLSLTASVMAPKRIKCVVSHVFWFTSFLLFGLVWLNFIAPSERIYSLANTTWY